MPIEIEAPEGFGYKNIDCNLSESSFTDQKLSEQTYLLIDETYREMSFIEKLPIAASLSDRVIRISPCQNRMDFSVFELDGSSARTRH
jgi:hypothetical protein